MKIKEEIVIKAKAYAEGYRCPATNENEYCKHDIISAYNNGYTQCQEDMADNKYTEKDIRIAMIVALVSNNVKGSEDIEDYINSLNKQD